MKTARILLTIMGIIMCASIAVHAQNSAKHELTASIAGQSSGEITKDLLLSRDTIVCSDPKYVIVGFKFSYVSNGDVVEMVSNSSVLSNQMQTAIKKLEQGAKFYIEEVVAKSNEGEVKKLAAMLLKIK